MAEDRPYLLDHASIFITANKHVPILLEPGSLIENGIISGDWKTDENAVSLTDSHVNYSNGIRLIMNLESFQIVEPGQASFQNSYLIHNIADAFLKRYPHIAYQNVGLNYLAAFVHSDPQQWLLERFTPSYLHSKGSNDIVAMMPKMFFGMGEELRAICRIELVMGSITRDEEDKSVVGINVNIDHLGSLNTADIQTAVGLWREKQDFLISTLDRIFGEIEDE